MSTQRQNAMHQFMTRNTALTITGLTALGFAGLTATLMAVDPRTLAGDSVWLKPFKFSLAFGVYFLTLAWILGYVSNFTRTTRWIVRGNILGFVLEALPLGIQASRGVASHFNEETLFDHALFVLMGIGAVGQTILLLVLTCLMFRVRIPAKPAFVIALRAGMILFLLGMLPGFVMIMISSHSIGGHAGHALLPLFRWNLEAGDLRVPHFIGMHALQLLPLAGAVVTRHFSNSIQMPIVKGLIAMYGIIFVTSFGLALSGLPSVALTALWQAWI